MNKNKTIRIGKETHKKLLAFKADAMVVHGTNESFDSIILDALTHIEDEAKAYEMGVRYERVA